MVKYQIFVSSTYDDLVSEREQVIKAILEMGHIPVGMEMFSAADEQQWEIIKKQIDQSDYYIVIVAHRYGSMDGELSFTEKEYDYAVSRKIPVMGFILDSDVKWPEKWKENNNDIIKRLEKLISKVSCRMVSSWKSSDDLYGKCCIALMKEFSSNPREGWVRASEANTSDMTTEITRLSRENGLLRKHIQEKEAAKEEGQEVKVNEIIDALRYNKRRIFVFRKTAADWGDPIDTSLLQIFEVIAPDLLDEAPNKTLIEALAFHFAGNDVKPSMVAVPPNFMKAYLADLSSLDLVSTSTKRHSVSDTKAYWMLTQFGQEVHSKIRKNELLKGLVKFEEVPEEWNKLTARLKAKKGL